MARLQKRDFMIDPRSLKRIDPTLVATAVKDGKTFTDTLVVSYTTENPDPAAIITTSGKAVPT